MKAGRQVYRRTGAAALLFLLIGIFWYWTRSSSPTPTETEQAAVGRTKPAGFPIPTAKEDDDAAPSRERATVQIPIAMVAAIYCNVFDETNGALDPKFTRFLRLAPEERQGVRRIIAEHVLAFGEIEVANYEIERSTGAAVIRLKPCEQQATALMAKTQRALTEVLGASRGEAAASWLSTQLRDGGRYWVDVTMERRNDLGGWTLTRVYGTRAGDRNSSIGSPPLPTRDFAQFFRWRHLDRIDLDAGE